MDTVPFLINGREVETPRTFPVVSPANGRVLYRACSASTADMASAVRAAAAALPAWRAAVPSARRDVLQRAAAALEARQAELVGYMRAETGASAEWAAFNLTTATAILRDAAARAGTEDGMMGSAPTTQDPDVGALVLREPYGVVAALAPWNAPYILGVRAVAFPLAAGNTVVLKGAERAPRCMWAIGSVVAAAAAAAGGLPAGVLSVVYAGAESEWSGEPEVKTESEVKMEDVSDGSADSGGDEASRFSPAAVTETLIAHHAVHKVNFTGSTAVGRIIGRLAGQHLKPVLLELGGKASAIVWRDADLDRAAAQCTVGAFLHAGQICMSTERLIVHTDVFAAFVAKLDAYMRTTFGEDENGSLMVSATAAAKTHQLVADAVAQGAHVVAGRLPSTPPATAHLPPVAVADVTPAMALYHEESFGPVVCLFAVRTEEEALQLANDTGYGLSSAVFTEDLRRGLRMARALEAGAVHINGMTVHDEPALPHGGVKGSGFGRFNGGLAEWVRTKTVTYLL